MKFNFRLPISRLKVNDVLCKVSLKGTRQNCRKEKKLRFYSIKMYGFTRQRCIAGNIVSSF